MENGGDGGEGMARVARAVNKAEKVFCILALPRVARVAHVRARMCVHGPGRADPPARAYVRVRACASPHHSLHPRQEDEGKGEFRGEGVVRVARV